MKVHWISNSEKHGAVDDLPVKFNGDYDFAHNARWVEWLEYGYIHNSNGVDRAFDHEGPTRAFPEPCKLGEFLALFEGVDELRHYVYESYHAARYDALLVITHEDYAEVRLVKG